MRPRPEGRRDFVSGQNRADREAATQCFGGTDDVGRNTVMLVGKQFARMPHTGLHFVQNQQCAVFVAQTARGLQIFLRRGQDAAFALNRLDDYGASVFVDGSF